MKQLSILLLSAVIWLSSCAFPFSKKPWRDYSLQPFSEEKWKGGDALDRGRMFRDLREKTEGKRSREEMLGMLGEPDEITMEKGVEYIWYNTEHAGRRGLLKRPIGFTREGKAVFGIDE